MMKFMIIMTMVVLFGGCRTSRDLPFPYIISTPAAYGVESGRVDYLCPFGHACVSYTNIPVDPNRVYIGLAEKYERDGNVYEIKFGVMTNCNSNTGGDLIAVYNSVLATSTWPVVRGHIDLSLDGGSNYLRRIGFGIKRSPDKQTGSFLWSPGYDRSLFTDKAKLRFTSMDGGPIPDPLTSQGYPFGIPAGQYIESCGFPICGAVIESPAEGGSLYAGSTVTLRWRQGGAGSIMDVGWLTQADPYFHKIATLSNCVSGINVQSILVTIPIASAVKLAVWSASDRCITGYSGVFEVIE